MSRDARQAPNSIFAEKTSIQRWGKRPSFPQMVNSPRETRVAKKLLPGNGVSSLLSISRLLFPFSARVTRAQDPFLDPETIARRCGDHPSSIWMEDPPRDTRDARKHIAGRWGKRDPAPFAPPSSCPRSASSDARHASREDAPSLWLPHLFSLSSPSLAPFMRGRDSRR